MNNCEPIKEFDLLISESNEFEQIINASSDFDLRISDSDNFEMCLPYANANNYLQYGDNPEDLIDLGGDVSYLIYK